MIKNSQQLPLCCSITMHGKRFQRHVHLKNNDFGKKKKVQEESDKNLQDRNLQYNAKLQKFTRQKPPI